LDGGHNDFSFWLWRLAGCEQRIFARGLTWKNAIRMRRNAEPLEEATKVVACSDKDSASEVAIGVPEI
jgi:hypothetical protein